MEGSNILHECREGVCELRLNRPEKLNSFTEEMALELQELLAMYAKQEEVRVLVLSASGRAFCAGQDLNESLPKDGVWPDLGNIVAKSYNPIVRLIRETEKPFICAVNGVAAGAGANLALACDFVMAAESANFVQSFSNVGLVPDTGGTFFLPRLVGLGQATAMMMLGEKVSGSQAASIGMIYRVVPDAELEREVRTLAQRVAQMPTKALGLTKRALNGSYDCDLKAQLACEQDLQYIAGQSEDYREGVTAFLEKREPNFQGK